MKVLLDTNIVLDYILKRSPFYEYSTDSDNYQNRFFLFYQGFHFNADFYKENFCSDCLRLICLHPTR